MLPLWTPLWFNLELSSPSLLLIAFLIFTFATILSRLLASPMERGSCTMIDPKPSMAQQMRAIRNPFTLVLDENQSRDDHLEKGVKIKITSDRPFWLTSYWGTNITEFHKSLKLDWSEIDRQLREKRFLVEHSLDSSDPEKKDPQNKETVIVATIKSERGITPEMLGTSPRSCYPLVVILSIIEEDDDEDKEEDGQREGKGEGKRKKGKDKKVKSSGDDEVKKSTKPDEVVCLVSVIHVRDNICPMDTNIITQLTKLRSGGVISLQSLYTPGETVEDEGARPVTMCVICQDKGISRALLPCRHACVCGDCYGLIDKCPLCRSYIRSFFLIGDEFKLSQESREQEAKDKSPTEPPAPRRKFGERIGEFLRFRARPSP